MGKNSGIEWTDHTFNPWIGCTKVSPACANCYAERDFDHRYGKVKWGLNGTRVVTSESNWRKPVQWNAEAAKNGVRERVFCASLADVFEDWDGPMLSSRGGRLYKVDSNPVRIADETDEAFDPESGDWLLSMSDVRMRLFQLIEETPHLDWLLLTKRPENIRRMWPCGTCEATGKCVYRKNVWLGTSVESQEYAWRRIPELMKCRDLSPVLFLSCEPVVGPISLWPWAFKDCPNLAKVVTDPTGLLHECCSECQNTGASNKPAIDWVIAGGESGPNARPAEPNWFRSLRDQCRQSGVAFHFKQWGEFDEDQNRVGKKASGRLLDGVEWNHVPFKQDPMR